jgi:hypothetical protein
LRKDLGGSADAVVRKALDALSWSSMAQAARRMTPRQREEYQDEATFWDRAVIADAARPEK